jgi:hypothetical protein
MSETLKERLDNLEMFLLELAKESPVRSEEVRDQANYHLATMELLKIQIAGEIE